MAVDITKLDEDELLPTLGDGEWVIAMPQGYPVLRVSLHWRDALITWAGRAIYDGFCKACVVE
jgi:hypothetical protein